MAPSSHTPLRASASKSRRWGSLHVELWSIGGDCHEPVTWKSDVTINGVAFLSFGPALIGWIVAWLIGFIMGGWL